MTSRERVLAAINHKEPDYLPMDLGSNVSAGISGMAYANLKEYLGIKEGHTRIYDVVQQVAQPEECVLDLIGADALDVGRVYNEKDSDWYDVTLSNGKTGQWPAWFRPTVNAEGGYDVVKDGVLIARMPKGGMCFDQMIFPYKEDYPDNFDDLDHAHRFIEGEGGKYLHDAYQKAGFQGLATFGLGFRELSNNKKEIKTIADMKGLTIRGYSTIQIAAWQAIGATPTSTDWNELFVSMQQGLLDGQEAAFSTINDFSFYEVQKYITVTDHVFTCDHVLADLTWYNGLGEEDRALIDSAMQTAYEWQKQAYQEDLQNLEDRFVNEYGITVTYLDDSVKAEMSEKMAEATKSEIIKICGQEIYDKVQEYVEAVR